MIKDNLATILKKLPSDIELVGAVKTRTAEDVNQAIDGGLKIIGHNYIQEAWAMYGQIKPVRWHFIGHLQQNKAQKAVEMFDMIETVDSLELAQSLNRYSIQSGKIIDILIEINSAAESNKSGVRPEQAINLIKDIAVLPSVKIKGLMTMGPAYATPQELRPYFAATKILFEQIKNIRITNVDMQILSMGMSASYREAIEEGANVVRIGSAIFGPRFSK
ncbi:MAG: YggS family pyridoxal phosphate-dependent enzyme [Chloroflexi bacterium]|nr:YggS family pyridoxal phosphate-dependent enzyme [Chloroflexota bacterium]